MKKIIFALALVSSFSAFANNCIVEVSFEGRALEDIVHDGEVIAKKGSDVDFVNQWDQNLRLDDCVRFAHDKGAEVLGQANVNKGTGKISIKHNDLSNAELLLKLK